MKLSTEVKTHVIITFNKTEHFITLDQYKKLTTMGNDGFIEIDGSAIRITSVSEIIPVAKHKGNKETYTNYTMPKNHNQLQITSGYYSEKRRKHRFVSFKRGFLKGTGGSNSLTEIQKEIYSHMEQILNSLEVGKTNVSNYIK